MRPQKKKIKRETFKEVNKDVNEMCCLAFSCLKCHVGLICLFKKIIDGEFRDKCELANEALIASSGKSIYNKYDVMFWKEKEYELVVC